MADRSPSILLPAVWPNLVYQEIGRLLVESGLAQQAGDGTLRYRPEETHTAVVIVGDNGT